MQQQINIVQLKMKKETIELCKKVVEAENDDDFLSSYIKLTESLKKEVRRDIENEKELYGDDEDDLPYDEIEYGNTDQHIVTDGWKDGINFWILNISGKFPTAYVSVPEDHPYYGKEYDDVELPVHGGLSYSDDHIYNVTENKWILGWDYNHYGDYSDIQPSGHKWTTEEVMEDVRRAIDALNNI